MVHDAMKIYNYTLINMHPMMPKRLKAKSIFNETLLKHYLNIKSFWFNFFLITFNNTLFYELSIWLLFVKCNTINVIFE